MRRHRVPDILAAGEVIRRHGVEARVVRVLGDVVEAEADVVRQVGRVRTVDDARLQRREYLVEVHHDRRGAQILEDQGRHSRRRAELPVLEVLGVADGTGRRKRLRTRNPPADELHVVGVVQLVELSISAAVEQPGHLLVGVQVPAHEVAGELEGRVLAGLVGAAGHVAVEDAGRGRVEGLGRFHHRGRVEHLDLDLAVGHRGDVLDEFGGHLSGQRLRREMRLDAQARLCRTGGACRNREGDRGGRAGRRELGYGLQHGKSPLVAAEFHAAGIRRRFRGFIEA